MWGRGSQGQPRVWGRKQGDDDGKGGGVGGGAGRVVNGSKEGALVFPLL